VFAFSFNVMHSTVSLMALSTSKMGHFLEQWSSYGRMLFLKPPTNHVDISGNQTQVA